MQTIVGAITDTLGHASRTGVDGTVEAWKCPTGAFRPDQPTSIPLEWQHGGSTVGRVAYLEHRADGKLWVVAEADCPDLIATGPWMLSYDVSQRRTDGRCTLNAVALCVRSATVGMPYIEVREGKLWEAAVRAQGPDDTVSDLIRSAELADRKRRHGQPIRIADRSDSALRMHRWIEQQNNARSLSWRPTLRPRRQEQPVGFRRPAHRIIEWAAPVSNAILDIR